MLWFLRLFPTFRQMENLVAHQSEAIEESDGSLKQAQVRVNHLEERASALASENASLSHDNESLRDANHELIHEKSLLEDRLASAIADKDRMWSTMHSALEAERGAYRMQINHLVQKSGGGIPYPDAHSIPAESVAKPQTPGPIGRSARVLPSEMAARHNTAFLRQFYETLGPQQDKSGEDKAAA